jgi:photosystem II biogenesis protein Psp29
MVEMHLLMVNTNFTYDAIYALGVVTAFDRFMEGYSPEEDRASIFNALCQAVNSQATQYRQDAEQVLQTIADLSWDDLVAGLSPDGGEGASARLSQLVSSVGAKPSFKYSRLFAIGLFTLLEKVDQALVKEKEKLEPILEKIAETFSLPLEKFKKDLELYQSNLDKLGQAKVIMEEAVQAERKKREQRQQEQAGGNNDTSDGAPNETVEEPAEASSETVES